MNEEQLALLRTLKVAVLRIRMIGYRGQQAGLSNEQSELVADIADAIHNIPDALESDQFDLDFQTKVMLGGLNGKYKDNSEAPDLLARYNAVLEQIKRQT